MLIFNFLFLTTSLNAYFSKSGNPPSSEIIKKNERKMGFFLDGCGWMHLREKEISLLLYVHSFLGISPSFLSLSLSYAATTSSQYHAELSKNEVFMGG